MKIPASVNKPVKKSLVARWSEGRVFLLGLAVIVLLGFFLRVNHLTADAPRSLSWSLSPYADEGAHVINAKDKILFGQWLMDEWFRMGVSPLFTVTIFGVFKVFGFGYLQARSVSVAAAVMVMLLIFFLLRRSASLKVAFVGIIFTATSYLWIMQNRLAGEETILVACLFLAVWFWTRPGQDLWRFFAAGGLVGIAVLFLKVLGLFFVPVLFLEFARQRWLVPDSALRPLGWKSLLWFGTGIAIAGVIWVGTILLPFWKPVTAILAASTTESAGGHPTSVGAFLKNVLIVGTDDRLMPRAPFLFLFLFWGLFSWSLNFKDKLRQASSVEFIGLSWVICGFLFLATMNYHPIRYQTILLPGTFLISAFTFGNLWVGSDSCRGGGLKSPPTADAPNVWNWVLVWLVILFFVFNFLRGIIDHMLNHPEGWLGLVGIFASDPIVWFQQLAEQAQKTDYFVFRAFIVATVATLAWWGWGRVRRHHLVSRGKSKFGLAVAIGLLLLSTVSDITQYASWAGSPTYTIVSLSRDQRQLPPGSVVAGPWAGAVTMEAPVRALMMQEFCNVDRVLERFPVTHLVIFQGGWEHRFFQEQYPDVLKQCSVRQVYQLPIGTLYLLELPSPSNVLLQS